MVTRTPLAHSVGYVTDGGMETDLIFHHGFELPEFAAYPLLDSPPGRAALSDYYSAYAAIAQSAGAGLLLESPTWRANPDWGWRVGTSPKELSRVNEGAIAWLRELATTWQDENGQLSQVLLVGMVGPRGDGYAMSASSAEDAQSYHRAQITAFAEAGADLVHAYTLTGLGEAIGVVLAAREAEIPVGVSFTVETDGRLPDGSTLGAAIEAVDAVAAPDHYLVNCAHPQHISRSFRSLSEEQKGRVRGIRGNASPLSHAELDEAETLHEGDPQEYARSTHALSAMVDDLSVRGGCCGTDSRHVAAVWAD